MIITLTKQEFTSLMNVIDTIEGNGSNKLKKTLKDNKIVVYRITSVGLVEIQISSEHTEDFLAICEKFIGLFTSQTKALYESVCLFQQETELIIDKYTKEKTEEKENDSPWST